MPGPTGSRVALALGVGLAAGFLSGLLGVGGGIVLVPGLMLAMAVGQREASANSLVAIIPISLVGVATYALLGSQQQVRFDLGLLLAAGSVAGAVVGARISHRIPERGLRVAFGVFALAVAARLLISGTA